LPQPFVSSHKGVAFDSHGLASVFGYGHIIGGPVGIINDGEERFKLARRYESSFEVSIIDTVAVQVFTQHSSHGSIPMAAVMHTVRVFCSGSVDAIGQTTVGLHILFNAIRPVGLNDLERCGHRPLRYDASDGGSVEQPDDGVVDPASVLPSYVKVGWGASGKGG
jgi:hypothetical protein